MTLKVHISPNYVGAPVNADNGGIRRVIEAEIKHLPKFDVEVVSDPRRADVIQNHGQMLTYAPSVPVVHTGHGLYWSRQAWEAGYQEVNRMVVESMSRAVAWTAPSNWVNRAIRRGGLWYPETVYHGVDADEFEVPTEYGNYVLWNKARADYVSNPQDMQTLADTMNDVHFWTTVGRAAPNVRVLGTLPHLDMKGIVARAGVYLATARETFGIGTLEAMACGVPVAGWDWGGQSEIIVPGETGWLAPPGDYKALAECVRRCFAERDRLGANARADVESRWKWEPRIEQYARIFRQVHETYNRPRPAVSVIVTTYKLDRYLNQCLDSVRNQTRKDWECIVVDDANSHETWKLVEPYVQADQRFRYVPTPHNLGLPGARNLGFNYAQGRYIRHLDADDWLAENALELEAGKLDSEPGMHIVYGHLAVANEDGSIPKDKSGEPVRAGWPPEKFDWLGQMAHLNQLPSCVLARREVFERSGGYRERMRRNEDAEFWCRVTSLGFRAVKITQAVTYYHRQREDSKGNLEWKHEGGEPDWTAWFPWRVGARDYQEATQILRKYSGEHPAPHLVPFGSQGQAPRRAFWHVHDFAYPVVSVIVTVGPGHEKYMVDALDSVWAQSYPDWECFVVNDTGHGWGGNVPGFPWAEVVETGGNRGAAAARNAAFARARGRFVIWLDADDIWLPWTLEVLVAHAERNAGIIYSDAILEKLDERSQPVRSLHRFENFSCDRAAGQFKFPGSSVLYPYQVARAVFDLQGGWDEKIPGQEDMDWQIAALASGACAFRVPEALFVYRMWTTTKRESDFAKIDIISEYLNAKWPKYRMEGKPMCSCGGSTQLTASQPSSILESAGNFDTRQFMPNDGTPTQMVQLEYVGSRAETFTLRSRVMGGKSYRFGNNAFHKEQTVFRGDADYFLTLYEGERPQFRLVQGQARLENRDPAAVGMGVTEG